MHKEDTSVNALEMDLYHEFDVSSPVMNERYADVCEELVTRCPVAHSPMGQSYWIVGRFNDVQELANDWQDFTNGDGVIPNRPSFDEMMRLLPDEIDPPEHTSIRRAINRFFTKAVVEGRQDEIRQIADDFIKAFIDDGHCEFVAAFTSGYPATVVARLFLDVPEEDIAYLRETLEAAFLHVRTPEDQQAAFERLIVYVQELLTRRESSGVKKDDVTDALLALVEPTGAPYPLWKKASILVNLIAGGLETTGSVLAGGMAYLAEHPAEQQRLADDRSLIPSAVEEFLRVYMPVFGVGRTSRRTVNIAGRTLPAGDSLLLAWGAANRDPSVFPDPRECRIDRFPNPHLAFASGPHRCPGSHLARVMLTVAFEQLLRRLGNIRLAGDVPTTTAFLRHIVAVPISFDGTGDAGSATAHDGSRRRPRE